MCAREQIIGCECVWLGGDEEYQQSISSLEPILRRFNGGFTIDIFFKCLYFHQAVTQAGESSAFIHRSPNRNRQAAQGSTPLAFALFRFVFSRSAYFCSGDILVFTRFYVVNTQIYLKYQNVTPAACCRNTFSVFSTCVDSMSRHTKSKKKKTAKTLFVNNTGTCM